MMEMDENNEQNPHYQSMKINRERILKIFDNLLEKIEIVLCLEEIMATEPQLLKDLINEEELQTYMEEASRTTLSKKSSSRRSTLSTLAALEKRELENLRFNTMISTIRQTPAIMEKVYSILFETSSNPPNFLMKMFDLREIIKTMIHDTASEEKAFCKLISYSWRNNEMYKKRNKDIKDYFDLKKEEFNNKIEQKNILKESYLQNITLLNEQCKYDIQAIIWRSEKRMRKMYMDSQDVQFNLSEEARQITDEYHTLLENHLSQEKLLRKKKYKIETVLAGWINNYDNNIGELQIQLEEQKDGYDGEKAKYDALNAQFMEQTELYDVLMAEKKEEEERIWNIKYFAFLKQRSALVIQRWWRRIYYKKFKKKKGKGKKGKKK